MMTSSNGNIFRVTGPLCREFTGPGEFPTQRPVTRSFDVFFDLRPNKRPWGWWFGTPSWSLWCQCNEMAFSRVYWGHLRRPVVSSRHRVVEWLFVSFGDSWGSPGGLLQVTVFATCKWNAYRRPEISGHGGPAVDFINDLNEYIRKWKLSACSML